MSNSKGTLGWATLDRLVQAVVAFGFQIALARLLTPHDFGIVALTAVFIAVATSMADAGFANALVQKKDLSAEDSSSVFYFNVVLAAGFALLLLAAAPSIGVLYGEADLAAVLAVLSLRVVLGIAGAVPMSLLMRRMEFRRIFWVNAPAQIVGGVAGVAAAIAGLGVWSLVIQAVGTVCVSTIAVFILARWRPLPVFSWAALRRMAPFGARVFGAGIADQVFGNLYQLVIGWAWNAATVGLYARALNLQQFPVSNISSIAAGVSFPLLSRRQDSPGGMVSATRGAAVLVCLAGFPAMLGMMAVAEPLVLVLLGEQWRECVPYVRVLCLGGLLFPLSAINVAVLKAAGRADLFLRVELMKKVLVFVVLVLSVPFGIMAMIWGQVACAVLSYLLNARMTARVIDYRLRNQVADALPALVLAALMAAVVSSAMHLPLPLAARLITGIAIGVAVYAAGVSLWLRSTGRRWGSLRDFLAEPLPAAAA